MNWDKLPLELRVMILSVRHEMREDARGTIVRCWEKFQAPKKVAQHLVETERMYISPMDVMYHEVASIMEYNVKVLSGKEDPVFWKEVLEEVDYELWVNEYTGGPGAEYYERNEEAFVVLARKFGYRLRYTRRREFYGTG